MKLQLVVLNLVVILCTACADECPPGMFQCGNGDCIKNCDICDSKPDCPDDSDENQDCNPCGHFGFQCADGQCTDLDYVCDGKDDCADGSDERDANGDCPSCPTHSIQCLHNGRETCVPKCWICDRYIDCDDSSDEPEGCEMTVSPVNPSSVPFF